MPVLRSCPICSTHDYVPVVVMPSPTHPLRGVVCEGCGLVYVNPMFTNAEKDERSPVLRLLHRSRSTEHSADAAFQHSLRRMRRSFAGLKPHLQAGQRVLEVGSGDGAMLSLLKDAGVQPCGLDMDSASAEATASALGVPVRSGVFEETDFGDERYDAVLMIHIIEHFFEPVEVLRKAHDLLKPGGMVFLETPNILRPKVGPRRVFSFAHNYHFSPRTLALALHTAGFRVTAMREYRRDSFQIAAQAVSQAELGPPPQTHSCDRVVAALLKQQRRYYTSLQFLWRKLPLVRERLVYNVQRDITGAPLDRWLGRAA